MRDLGWAPVRVRDMTRGGYLDRFAATPAMLGADPTNKVKNGYALAFAVPCPLAEGLDDCAVLAFSSRAIRNARKLRQAQRLR